MLYQQPASYVSNVMTGLLNRFKAMSGVAGHLKIHRQTDWHGPKVEGELTSGFTQTRNCLDLLNHLCITL